MLKSQRAKPFYHFYETSQERVIGHRSYEGQIDHLTEEKFKKKIEDVFYEDHKKESLFKKVKNSAFFNRVIYFGIVCHLFVKFSR